MLLLTPVFAAAQEPARYGTVRREAQWVQEIGDFDVAKTADSTTFAAPFRIPFEWVDRRQFVRLEGVSGAYTVNVNGRKVAENSIGAEPAEFDITEASREGVNELQIVIREHYEAEILEDSHPETEPKLLGGVKILSQPLMRVRDISVKSRFENANGLLELGVVMRSHRLNELTYNVAYELLSPDGQVVAWEDKDFSLDMRRDDTVRFFANVRGAKEWKIEEPNLYSLVVKTTQNGRTRERVSYKVAFQREGVRKFVSRKFDPSKDSVEKTKSEGVNLLILTGLPASDEFYDRCDRVGIFVCPTADIDTHKSGESRRRGGNPSNDPAFSDEYRRRALAMYHRAKNHPSVAMFSLAADGSANGINLYENYLILKQLEPSRPVVYDTEEWNSD